LNYQKVYNQIIIAAQNRSHPMSIVERHHIVPKSLGGSNEPSNIVKVTPREHFILHKLLVKMSIGLARRKMINAFCYMAFTRNNKCLSRPVSSRDYEYARSICKDGMYTEERNRKISKSRLAKLASGWRQVRTDETKQKHRETLKAKKDLGIGLSDLHRQAISKGLIGNTNWKNYRMPETHKIKVRESNSREYKIKSPDGNEFIVKNLSEWLKTMNCGTRMVDKEYKRGPLKGFTIHSISQS